MHTRTFCRLEASIRCTSQDLTQMFAFIHSWNKNCYLASSVSVTIDDEESNYPGPGHFSHREEVPEMFVNVH